MKNIGNFFLILILGSCGSTLNSLHKKHTNYEDYSDNAKLEYYSKNKRIVDSLVLLCSNKYLIEYIKFKSETSKDYWLGRTSNDIYKDFPDISTAGFWADYQKAHFQKGNEVRSVIIRMKQLSDSIKSINKIKPQTNISFLTASIYIPLKIIQKDIDGGARYSCLVIFDPAKINIDSVKKQFYPFENLRQIECNILTNEINK